MKSLLWENLIKNIILIILLVLSNFKVNEFIASSPLLADKAINGSFLIAVSVLAVIACFGNFAFTYEKMEYKSIVWRILAHSTTGLFMFLIGLSLEMTASLSYLLIGNFFIFNLSLFIIYIASVLYDFWDLKKCNL